MSTATAGGLVTPILIGLGALIAILWILMPFGTKDLLKQLLRKKHKTNVPLQAQADRAQAAQPSRAIE